MNFKNIYYILVYFTNSTQNSYDSDSQDAKTNMHIVKIKSCVYLLSKTLPLKWA